MHVDGFQCSDVLTRFGDDLKARLMVFEIDNRCFEGVIIFKERYIEENAGENRLKPPVIRASGINEHISAAEEAKPEFSWSAGPLGAERCGLYAICERYLPKKYPFKKPISDLGHRIQCCPRKKEAGS